MGRTIVKAVPPLQCQLVRPHAAAYHGDDPRYRPVMGFELFFV